MSDVVDQVDPMLVEKVQLHQEQLVREIRTMDCLDFLFHWTNAITPEEWRQISSDVTIDDTYRYLNYLAAPQHNNLLLRTLMQKGNEACRGLYNYLKKWQSHLAETLDNAQIAARDRALDSDQLTRHLQNRVAELERLLPDMQRDHQVEMTAARNRIRQLEAENQQLRHVREQLEKRELIMKRKHEQEMESAVAKVRKQAKETEQRLLAVNESHEQRTQVLERRLQEQADAMKAMTENLRKQEEETQRLHLAVNTVNNMTQTEAVQANFYNTTNIYQSENIRLHIPNQTDGRNNNL